MRLEPVAKAIHPVVTWQPLLFQSEAVTTKSALPASCQGD